MLIQLGLPSALQPRRASAQAHSVVLAASTSPATEAATLSATPSGFSGTLTYQWLRSSAHADANYVEIAADGTTATGPSQYRLSSNAHKDPGFFYKVRVSDGTGAMATSNGVVIAPEAPKPVHPAGETVYIRHPRFNVQKVGEADAGLYIYDLHLATDRQMGNIILNKENDPVQTEREDNNGVTFWRYPQFGLTTNTTYYWRTRARLGNVVGPWSETVAFTMATTLWSEDGNTWHWPTDANTRLAGTFMEAYHGGELGTGLHGGLDISRYKPNAAGTANGTDICNTPIRAARSGILAQATENDTATTQSVNRVRLVHTDITSQTHYLHMRSLTDLPLGTFVNQGAEVGKMSDAGAEPSCHLHLNVTNYVHTSSTGDLDATIYYNPLFIRFDGWKRPYSNPPTVSAIYLRASPSMTAASTNIGGNVTIIAETVDPALSAAPASGTRLAPYRVQYFVASQGANPVDTVEFNRFSAGDDIDNYFVRTPTTYYRMYGRWNTAGLAENAGPQTIRVVASDFEGVHPELRPNPTAPFTPSLHLGERSLVIGPEWPANPVVTIDPCGANPQRVNVQLFNRNSQIANVANDTYNLTLTRPAGPNNTTVNAALVANQLMINNSVNGAGGVGQVRIDISKPFVNGTLHLVARSGILTNVRDAVDVQVQVPQVTCPGGATGSLEQPQDSQGSAFAMHTPVFGMQVGANARFNLGAYPDPLSGEETGASWSLSYGWPNRPGTSFSSFRVDGTDYIYGTDGAVLAPSTNLDGRTNSSSWLLGDVEVSQVLELPAAGLAGEQLATIRYTVRNTGDVSRSVGARVLLDTEVANADGFGYRTEDGVLTAEQALTGAAIPESFNVLSAENNATHQALAVVKEEGELAPDRLVFAPWSQLARVKYSYTVTPGRPLSDDGAYAVYWDASPLAPGETRTYVTYYGLAQVDAASIAGAAMALAVSAVEGQGG